ncbi:MAG: hypothetical protein HOH95_14525 [Dehalococcoidia bacterium]|jgi:hypothetical protein|nr:hypothetical protein [Dehalococcoidia bacterium]
MWNALALTVLVTSLLLPLAAGIVAYTRTGHRSFLQIPFAMVFVPIATSVLVVSLFAFDGGVAPRWVWRLPQLLVTVLLVDAIRRLERRLA